MKNLVVMAAGLGYEGLEKRGLLKMAGLEFRSAASAFPAGLIIQTGWLIDGPFISRQSFYVP